MFLSNNLSSINNIINTLSKSDLTEARIIHSKLEFKLNNFDSIYICNNWTNPRSIISFWVYGRHFLKEFIRKLL